MRRISWVAGAIAVCAVFPATAASGVTATGGDSVVGNGKLPATPSGCVNELTVVAHSNANGSNPRGSLSYDDNECNRFFIADVSCVRVEDNRASIVAEFAQNEADSVFAGILVWYEDNGPPVGGTPADFQQNRRLNAAQLANRQANGCPALIHPATRLAQGNLKIRDRDTIVTKARNG